MGKRVILLISGLTISAVGLWACGGDHIVSDVPQSPPANESPASTPIPNPTSDINVEASDPNPTATPLTGVLFTYTYAVQLVENGLYEEAIPQLNIIVKRIPELAKGWYYRGIAYRHQEQHTFALEDLNKAIELKPEFPNSYKERGILYRDLRQIEKARSDLEKALTMYDLDKDAQDYLEAVRILRELEN